MNPTNIIALPLNSPVHWRGANERRWHNHLALTLSYTGNISCSIRFLMTLVQWYSGYVSFYLIIKSNYSLATVLLVMINHLLTIALLATASEISLYDELIPARCN